MGYTLKNSTQGNTMFTAGGTAITSNTQPNLKGSTLAGVLDSSLPAKDVGLVSSVRPVQYTGFDNRSILFGYTTQLAEDSTTAIKSPGNPGIHPAIAKVNAIRTVKNGMSVRAGYWNPVSGQYQTTGGRIFSATANDFAAVGVDSEASPGRTMMGVHNYTMGGVPATGIKYSNKTQ